MRLAFRVAALLVAAVLTTDGAVAQSWPSKPVRFIVPFTWPLLHWPYPTDTVGGLLSSLVMVPVAELGEPTVYPEPGVTVKITVSLGS